MKKYFIFLLAFTLILSGCNSKYAKSNIDVNEAFDKSTTYMQNVKNYKLDMNLVMKIESENVETSMDETIKMVYDLKNKTAYTSIDMSVFGMNSSAEMYAKYDDTNVTNYTKVNDNWVKSTSVYNFSVLENQNVELINELKTAYQIKEIEADKNNYNYEVLISKEGFANIMKATNTSTDEFTSLSSMITDNIKFKLSLDKETFAISKIDFDLLDMIKDKKVEGTELKKFYISMKIYDYDKNDDVIIPEDALNAKELEQN